MNRAAPCRDYDALRAEVLSISDVAQLHKAVFKLLDENEKLAKENRKKTYALDQMDFLMHKLETELQKHSAEAALYKKCLAFSELFRDQYLRTFFGVIREHCTAAFLDHLSDFSRAPSFAFLSYAMDATVVSLMMARYIVEHYLENHEIYKRKFPAKGDFANSLVSIDEVLMLTTKVLESLHKCCTHRNGANGMKRTGKLSKANETKRRKKQLRSKLGKTPINPEVASTSDNETSTSDNETSTSDNETSTSEDEELENPVPVLSAEKSLNNPSEKLVVKLIDVLKYPSANLLKDIEANEFKVLDDVDASNEKEEMRNNDEECNLNQYSPISIIDLVSDSESEKEEKEEDSVLQLEESEEDSESQKEEHEEFAECDSDIYILPDIVKPSTPIAVQDDGCNSSYPQDSGDEEQAKSVNNYENDDEMNAQGSSKPNFPMPYLLGPYTHPFPPAQLFISPHLPSSSYSDEDADFLQLKGLNLEN